MKDTIKSIKQIAKENYSKNPLIVIILIAIVPRLVAVFFAKGYGMHDDHFWAVQYMQNALDNFDYVNSIKPDILLYPFMQFFTFWICELFNIFDPQAKMYIVRFFHSINSLLIVFLGYKITLQISTEKNAKCVGMILALLWIFPYMGVRNLVEAFVIFPVLAGIYYVLKGNNLEGSNNKFYIIAGIFLGIAFCMRFQIAFIPFGLGLAMLYQKQFKSFFILTISAILVSVLLLSIPEYIFWGKPFISLITALDVKDLASFPTSPWYMITLLIIGVLIPPMSLFWLLGYFRNWKKHLILFLPVFFFLVFHSIFPNKQERFILTIIPLFIIVCVTGWNDFIEQSKWWNKHKKIMKYNWIWFWSINSLLLLLFIFSYSKRTRVESFYHLSNKYVTGIVIETNENKSYFPPTFYLGENRNKPIYLLYENYEVTELEKQINKNENPNFIIFFDESNLQNRLNEFKIKYKCDLILEKEIEAGLLDKLLHFTNPKHNKNYTAFIYFIVI
ncbi:MAG: glycosyltransferase family 39 protein [Bacteroidetes bacterium]|nr:glycosyltransferase family 39 protein [Bacteroidota bacterium]